MRQGGQVGRELKNGIPEADNRACDIAVAPDRLIDSAYRLVLGRGSNLVRVADDIGIHRKVINGESTAIR
ncbi:hypothetical protein D3C72_2503330 [compost metagenome]